MSNLFLASMLQLCSCGRDTNDLQNASSREKDSIRRPCTSFSLRNYSPSVRRYYDSAVWALYIWHCDKPYKLRIDSGHYKGKTFGALSINLDSVHLRHDTAEYLFHFFDGDKKIRDNDLALDVRMMNGVAFDTLSGKKLYMISLSNYSESVKGGANRFENALQPDIVQYIQSQWVNLDTCFRWLAQVHGLAKDK
jgi:hypothetical protein